jgi:hypothetical protein
MRLLIYLKFKSFLATAYQLGAKNVGWIWVDRRYNYFPITAFVSIYFVQLKAKRGSVENIGAIPALADG